MRWVAILALNAFAPEWRYRNSTHAQQNEKRFTGLFWYIVFLILIWQVNAFKCPFANNFPSTLILPEISLQASMSPFCPTPAPFSHKPVCALSAPGWPAPSRMLFPYILLWPQCRHREDNCPEKGAGGSAAKAEKGETFTIHTFF